MRPVDPDTHVSTQVNRPQALRARLERSSHHRESTKPPAQHLESCRRKALMARCRRKENWGWTGLCTSFSRAPAGSLPQPRSTGPPRVVSWGLPVLG